MLRPPRVPSIVIRQCSAGGECRAAIGPFPFADGSPQPLSSDLMLAVTGAPKPNPNPN